MKPIERPVYMLLTLVLVFAFGWAFNILPVKASPGTVYIRANGSVEGTTNIVSSDNVTYNFIADISDSIVVQRDNIILNGAGHKVQGTGLVFPTKGIGLWGRKNVTIQSVVIESFYYGIDIEYNAMNDRIFGCNITSTHDGIFISSSSSINVTGNTFADNIAGITLASSPNNHIIANTFINDGLYVSNSTGNFVDGNVVNGKPLVYLESVSNQNVTDAGQVILISCSNIRVESLSISNATVGIELWGTNNSKIIKNNVAHNSFAGIYLDHSSNNNIAENIITNNVYYGIYLIFSSSSNSIIANNVTHTQQEGIVLDGASNNNIIGNNITHNLTHGMYLAGSSDNSVYHNNFIDNTQQVYIVAPGYANSWDDDSPSGGNYWSDYGGTDANQDGLGGNPYTMDADNRDNHPLMGPFKTFNAGTWNTITYNVDIVSKSTLTNFSFNPDNGTLSFDVAGQTGTTGFCRVTIHKGFMWVDNQDEWIAKVDGTAVQRKVNETSSYTYIYFSYSHSTKTVQIQSSHAVPENLQSLLLAIFGIATTMLIILKKSRKIKLSR